MFVAPLVLAQALDGFLADPRDFASPSGACLLRWSGERPFTLTEAAVGERGEVCGYGRGRGDDGRERMFVVAAARSAGRARALGARALAAARDRRPRPSRSALASSPTSSATCSLCGSPVRGSGARSESWRRHRSASGERLSDLHPLAHLRHGGRALQLIGARALEGDGPLRCHWWVEALGGAPEPGAVFTLMDERGAVPAPRPAARLRGARRRGARALERLRELGAILDAGADGAFRLWCLPHGQAPSFRPVRDEASRAYGACSPSAGPPTRPRPRPARRSPARSSFPALPPVALVTGAATGELAPGRSGAVLEDGRVVLRDGLEPARSTSGRNPSSCSSRRRPMPTCAPARSGSPRRRTARSGIGRWASRGSRRRVAASTWAGARRESRSAPAGFPSTSPSRPRAIPRARSPDESLVLATPSASPCEASTACPTAAAPPARRPLRRPRRRNDRARPGPPAGSAFGCTLLRYSATGELIASRPLERPVPSSSLRRAGCPLLSWSWSGRIALIDAASGAQASFQVPGTAPRFGWSSASPPAGAPALPRSRGVVLRRFALP